MKKVLLLSSIVTLSLFADHSLGQQLSGGSSNTYTTQQLKQTPVKSYSKVINNPQQVQRQSYRSDDHRYDERYRNFDYNRYAYDNDDGYNYGYFDSTGYFYNNIYFTYDNQYTYNDRYYHRGLFAPHQNHHRYYIHHTHNQWNRIHAYRQPNVIVYGHYYEQSYSPNHQSSYYSNYSNYPSQHYYGNHQYNSPSYYNRHNHYNSYGHSDRAQMTLGNQSHNYRSNNYRDQYNNTTQNRYRSNNHQSSHYSSPSRSSNYRSNSYSGSNHRGGGTAHMRLGR